ncbi:tRNA 2-selenouridine(34) synthase MnmH [Thioclava sp. SK-1]|uniref:tRNA 2-selenouridine(34) synthase MnmH n=1 Tax=Thioclava sp. SK-1 TaxID=1889770 RepID=UPI0008255367|nr:tRNA 2-selenouridine(34) synthase MnmH [Thioclava sp. SK-1]OCX63149.1 tRNA 2-selenouridine(34) synthase MnmH [Thioclava sp. SK-1]
MPFTLTSVDQLADLPFDTLIDVRSPAEFAEDHIPGAINCPALNNAQRAEVGTIYVQEDRFKARKIGAAYVAQNAATALQTTLADKPGSWKPLVYCWRGGQRSGSFNVILQQIGWRAETVEGGYKSYREMVANLLYKTEFLPKVVLIDGNTGTAKTRLLYHLKECGAQVLDLEGLAEHRGSIFGPTNTRQPKQKMFESRLAHDVVRLDPARPVFVEAECSKIGRLIVPPSLWQKMIVASRVFITAPISARVDHLLDDYADLIADPARLDVLLSKLVRYHGHEQVNSWRALAGAGAFAQLTQELINVHYDPRYERVSKSEGAPIALPDLEDATLRSCALNLIQQADGYIPH